MDEKETLGSYLKHQRESQKISIREMAKSTRVREHIIRAIEEDQHDLLPPATYVKGFLLAYARYLKLDPKDVLLRYETSLKGEPVAQARTQPPKPKEKIPPTQPPKPKEKIPPTQPPKPKQKISPKQLPKPKKKILWNTKQTWVIVGVIVASFTIFYFFSPYSSKPPIDPVPEKSVPEIPPEKPTTEEKIPVAPSPPAAATTSVPPLPPPPVTATTSIPEKKPVSLQLKAIEETWVSLQTDDQPDKQMTLKPGEGISVQASNRIRMILGNAGGLDLILNGKALEKFGKSGEVLTLFFTSGGVEIKRPEKPKPPKEESPDTKTQNSN